MTWRYLTPPLFNYRVLLAERSGQPVGYAAYRLEESLGRKVGSVAEVFTDQDDVKTRGTLISHVIEALQAAGAEQVAALAIPGTPIWQAFQQTGFFARASFSVQLVPLDPKLPMDILRDLRSWNIAGGDFDVV
ncbi:MAG: hypothetical protein ACREUU_12820 [Gammaproteobacteria bacterium]